MIGIYSARIVTAVAAIALVGMGTAAVGAQEYQVPTAARIGFQKPDAFRAESAVAADRAQRASSAATADQVSANGIQGLTSCSEGYATRVVDGAFTCVNRIETASTSATAQTASYASAAATAAQATTISGPIDLSNTTGTIDGSRVTGSVASASTATYAANAGAANTAQSAQRADVAARSEAFSGRISVEQIAGNLDANRITGVLRFEQLPTGAVVALGPYNGTTGSVANGGYGLVAWSTGELEGERSLCPPGFVARQADAIGQNGDGQNAPRAAACVKQ